MPQILRLCSAKGWRRITCFFLSAQRGAKCVTTLANVTVRTLGLNDSCWLGLLDELPKSQIWLLTMAVEVLDPLVKGSSGEKSRTLIRVVILCIVAAAAVASRLFSVIRM